MTNKTELIFIIDRSGSMYDLKSDTIGGFNSMLKQQKQVEGELYLTTVLFNHEIKYLHLAEKIENVKEMTENDFETEGLTALYDAIGETIHELFNKKINSDPKNTLIFVMTDGHENSSQKYDYKKVKGILEEFQNSGGKVVFLGANINSNEYADKLGIKKEYSVDFLADKEGVSLNYSVISGMTTNFRKNYQLKTEELDKIKKDYKKRHHNKL